MRISASPYSRNRNHHHTPTSPADARASAEAPTLPNRAGTQSLASGRALSECTDNDAAVIAVAGFDCTTLAMYGYCTTSLCPTCDYAGYCDVSCGYCQSGCVSLENVATFDELSSATASNGCANITVVADVVVFSSPITIPTATDFEVASTIPTVLSGGDLTHMFSIYGDLTLRSFILTNGSSVASCGENYFNCAGGALYIGATGSLVLIDSIVKDCQATYGGAIFAWGGTSTLASSALEHNSATSAVRVAHATCDPPPLLHELIMSLMVSYLHA